MNGLVVKDVYEGLERYNCNYCGHFCAILNEKIENLPKRSTDRSTAVAKKHVLKQIFKEGDKKRIKRKKGIETQYRMVCPGCGLFVAYRSQKDIKQIKYWYICESALTQKATVSKAVRRISAESRPHMAIKSVLFEGVEQHGSTTSCTIGDAILVCLHSHMYVAVVGASCRRRH